MHHRGELEVEGPIARLPQLQLAVLQVAEPAARAPHDAAADADAVRGRPPYSFPPPETRIANINNNTAVGVADVAICFIVTSVCMDISVSFCVFSIFKP